MSVQNLEKIIQHELTVRRRSRLHLLGFSVATAIVLAAMFTAI